MLSLEKKEWIIKQKRIGKLNDSQIAISAGHTFDHFHAREIALGLLIGITSLIVLICNNKALKIWTKGKKI